MLSLNVYIYMYSTLQHQLAVAIHSPYSYFHKTKITHKVTHIYAVACHTMNTMDFTKKSNKQIYCPYCSNKHIYCPYCSLFGLKGSLNVAPKCLYMYSTLQHQLAVAIHSPSCIYPPVWGPPPRQRQPSCTRGTYVGEPDSSRSPLFVCPSLP